MGILVSPGTRHAIITGAIRADSTHSISPHNASQHYRSLSSRVRLPFLQGEPLLPQQYVVNLARPGLSIGRIVFQIQYRIELRSEDCEVVAFEQGD